MLDPSQIWTIGVGCIVFGVMLIGLAVGIAIFAVDWNAIRGKEARGNVIDR